MMQAGETAEVIRHNITLTNGKTFSIFQEPDLNSSPLYWQDLIRRVKQTVFNAAFWFHDIHGELHTFFIKDVAHHSMKMVKIKMKAADPNPFNHDYDNNELA